jgi:flagellar assembly protein FliH
VLSFWDESPTDAGARPSAPAQSPPPAPRAPEAEPKPSFAELEREAFSKGYAQGERAGAEAAAKRGEATLRRLAQTIEELGSLRTELVHKTERQVVELAVAIAGRILKHEVATDKELLIAIARVALERLGENTSATIRLNPDDFASIGGRTQMGDSAVVRVVADPLVSSGGCLVQSDFGLIDAGIDAQLAEMANALGVARQAGVRTGRDAA